MPEINKMIMKTEFLKKLRSAFDLNEYEVKIWISLLSKGVASAGELSDMASVPRSRAYDVLESLEKKGFIIMKIGRPIKYLAVKPAEIVSRVKTGIEKKATEQVNTIEKIKKTEVFDELNLLFENGITHIDPANISGSFKGRKNTYSQIASIMGEATEEIIIATTDTGLVRKADFLKDSFKKLSKKGVKVKIGAPLQTAVAKEVAKNLEKVASIKAMNLNARFVIADGKEMVFMVNDDSKVHETADVGIWVNAGFFASALQGLFEASWK